MKKNSKYSPHQGVRERKRRGGILVQPEPEKPEITTEQEIKKVPWWLKIWRYIWGRT